MSVTMTAMQELHISTTRNTNNNVISDKDTVLRLREKFQQLFRRNTRQASTVSSVKETDYCQDRADKESPDDRIPSPGSSYGTFDDPLVEMQCGELSTRLHNVIQQARQKQLHCELIVPEDLLHRVAKDVIRMSQNEPYGLRGCVVIVNLEQANTCCRIGRIDCDPETVATFELHLTLLEDKKRWFDLKNFIQPVVAACLRESWQKRIFLSPGFQLIKKKLYRPN